MPMVLPLWHTKTLDRGRHQDGIATKPHTYLAGRVLGERCPVKARLGAVVQSDRATVLGKGTATGRQGITVLVSGGASKQTSHVEQASNKPALRLRQ